MTLREMITTVFDVLGALLIAGSMFFLGWEMRGVGVGLAFSGAFLALVSAVWSRPSRKKG